METIKIIKPYNHCFNCAMPFKRYPKNKDKNMIIEVDDGRIKETWAVCRVCANQIRGSRGWTSEKIETNND